MAQVSRCYVAAPALCVSGRRRTTYDVTSSPCSTLKGSVASEASRLPLPTDGPRSPSAGQLDSGVYIFALDNYAERFFCKVSVHRACETPSAYETPGPPLCVDDGCVDEGGGLPYQSDDSAHNMRPSTLPVTGGNESPVATTALGESLALPRSATSRPLLVAQRSLELGTRPPALDIGSVIVLSLKAETPARNAWNAQRAAAKLVRNAPQWQLKAWSRLNGRTKKELFAQLAVS